MRNKVYYGTYKVYYYCFSMSTCSLMFGILKSPRVVPTYLAHVLIPLYGHLECSRTKTNMSLINIVSKYMEQKEQVGDLKRNRFLFQ